MLWKLLLDALEASLEKAFRNLWLWRHLVVGCGIAPLESFLSSVVKRFFVLFLSLLLSFLLFCFFFSPCRLSFVAGVADSFAPGGSTFSGLVTCGLKSQETGALGDSPRQVRARFSSCVSGHKEHSLGVSLSRTGQKHKGLVAIGPLLLGLWQCVSFGPLGKKDRDWGYERQTGTA